MVTGIVVVSLATLVGLLLFPRRERSVPYTVDRLWMAQHGPESWIERQLRGIEAAQAIHDVEDAAGGTDPADVG